MTTKRRLFLALTLLFPWPAFGSDDLSAEEIFRALCDRQVPKSASHDDRQLRSEFQKFLRSPKNTARALDRALASGARDLGSEIEMVFLYSQTCFLVETYARELANKGCYSGRTRIDPTEARRACAPVNATFKAAAEKAKAIDNAIGSENQAPLEEEASGEAQGPVAPAQ